MCKLWTKNEFHIFKSFITKCGKYECMWIIFNTVYDQCHIPPPVLFVCAWVVFCGHICITAHVILCVCQPGSMLKSRMAKMLFGPPPSVLLFPEPWRMPWKRSHHSITISTTPQPVLHISLHLTSLYDLKVTFRLTCQVYWSVHFTWHWNWHIMELDVTWVQLVWFPYMKNTFWLKGRYCLTLTAYLTAACD